MELRVLNYFLAVAREQSISAAAQALHISQPALSTQLKLLEEEVGRQLFIRGSKGTRRVVLTDEGLLLRKRAEEIMMLVRKTEDELANADETIVGDVYIGAGETEIIRCFARAAKKLRAGHPDIRYHISSGNAEHVLEYLDKGIFDFGLLLTEVDAQKYDSVELPLRDVWGVLMPRGCPLAEKESVTPGDLRGAPLIISHQCGDAQRLAGWLGAGTDELNVAATYNLVYNASLLVSEGLGFAVALDGLINTAGTNICFRPLEPRLEARAYIVWKKRQVFSKAAAAFLDCLRGSFGGLSEA